jgi:energy-coupling factor transport system substrate-specific component
MEKITTKKILAIGIGAVLFFIVGRFGSIPSGVPHTDITLQYVVLALFAAAYGPVAGGMIGFIGHSIIDVSWGDMPSWGWVIASVFVGVISGIICKKTGVTDSIAQGKFGGRQFGSFALANLTAHAPAWLIIAPCLDILLRSKLAENVFHQGAACLIIDGLTSIALGGLLLFALSRIIGYRKARGVRI